MRIAPRLTVAAAAVAFLLLLGAAWLALRPAGALLSSAGFSAATISPNADGVADIATFSYELARPADVSIYFLDAQGRRYDFRTNRPRASGEYKLLFSGIVEGFELPGEDVEGETLARVLPDGEYTWMVAARNDEEEGSLSGALTVVDADTALPDLRGFSISPDLFTPNRDGISDRTWVNLYLTKEAHVTVNLIDETGAARPIAEREGTIPPGEVGLHTFEYDGGVDLGESPPPDGAYAVVALAEDALGQKVRAGGELTVEFGGVPRADIVNATVEIEDTTVVLGDTLYFELTVENYGAAPIRTTGPAPDFIYLQDENSNTFGWFEESGAWRVGIDCDVCIRDYPWRWSLGDPSELTQIDDHYYLMPGQRATIRGGITITSEPARNPLYFWAGLIHEDVEISNVNNRVDPHFVTIVTP